MNIWFMKDHSNLQMLPSNTNWFADIQNVSTVKQSCLRLNGYLNINIQKFHNPTLHKFTCICHIHSQWLWCAYNTVITVSDSSFAHSNIPNTVKWSYPQLQCTVMYLLNILALSAFQLRSAIIASLSAICDWTPDSIIKFREVHFYYIYDNLIWVLPWIQVISRKIKCWNNHYSMYASLE